MAYDGEGHCLPADITVGTDPGRHPQWLAIRTN